jgi:hypothetical protein
MVVSPFGLISCFFPQAHSLRPQLSTILHPISGKITTKLTHPARVEEVDSEAGLLALAGEVVVRAEIAVSIPRLTEGFVPTGCFAIEGLRGLESVRVRGEGGTAEVVGEEEGECPVRADGDSGCPCELILGDNEVFHFMAILLSP